jgi:hypothetical protein
MTVATILDEKIEELPDAPGVYLFKDVSGDVLYVGKAQLLRSRVRSYFQLALSGAEGAAGVGTPARLPASPSGVDGRWILTILTMRARVVQYDSTTLQANGR